MPSAQSRGSLQAERPDTEALEETGAGGYLPGLLNATAGYVIAFCLLQHSILDALGAFRLIQRVWTPNLCASRAINVHILC